MTWLSLLIMSSESWSSRCLHICLIRLSTPLSVSRNTKACLHQLGFLGSFCNSHALVSIMSSDQMWNYCWIKLLYLTSQSQELIVIYKHEIMI